IPALIAATLVVRPVVPRMLLGRAIRLLTAGVCTLRSSLCCARSARHVRSSTILRPAGALEVRTVLAVAAGMLAAAVPRFAIAACGLIPLTILRLLAGLPALARLALAVLIRALASLAAAFSA